MKYGYGYECEPRALLDAGADRLCIDHGASNRSQRTWLFEHGLRAGDELLLLDRGDLGRGRESGRFEAMAEQAGVTIEIVPTPEKTKLKPGRKPGFDPTPEQAAICRHWWAGPFRRSDALREIAKIVGRDVSSDQLNRRIGLRGGGELK